MLLYKLKLFKRDANNMSHVLAAFHREQISGAHLAFISIVRQFAPTSLARST